MASRFSKNQKDALTVMFELGHHGRHSILIKDLLSIINSSRSSLIHRNNFAVSVRGLVERGLLEKRLTKSLNWIVSLTPKGLLTCAEWQNKQLTKQDD